MEVAMPGPFFWLFVVVALVTLAMAIKFAVRPAERTLSIVRPLCAAAAFASLASFFAGMANGLVAISHQLGGAGEAAATLALWRVSLGGLAEALAVLVLGTSVLTVCWLLVAVGLRRQV
jgi:hypothetical protein